MALKGQTNQEFTDQSVISCISHQTRIVKSVQNEAIMFKGSLCRIQLIDRSVGLDVFTRSENKTKLKILRFHTFSLFVKVHFLGFSLFFQKQILSGDFRGSPSHPRKIHPHPQKSPSPGIFSESDSSPIPIPIPGIWGWGSGIPKNPHPRCISGW